MFDFKKKTPKIFTTYKPRFVRIKVILKLLVSVVSEDQSCSPAHGPFYLMPHMSDRKLREREKDCLWLKKNVSGKFLCDSRSIGAGLF